jgi:hypothetical protein
MFCDEKGHPVPPIFENNEMRIERYGSWHPGFDSGIELALAANANLLGGLVWKNAGNGADAFGGAPLVIATELADGTVAIVYRFEWRWSPSASQMVLGWWYGDSEWDVARIQEYGPVGEPAQ